MSEGIPLLLVEDDCAVFTALRVRLQAEGYHVIPAPDGQTAITVGLRVHPAVALLDINLPIGDGLSVAEALRTRFPTLPLVFMTAGRSSNLRRETARFEHSWFIEKPFTTPFLLNQLRLAVSSVG